MEEMERIAKFIVANAVTGERIAKVQDASPLCNGGEKMGLYILRTA